MKPSPAKNANPAYRGLSSQEAAAAFTRVGRNELTAQARVSMAQVLLRQFTGLLVVILMVAAGIAYALGEVIDTIAIVMVVVLNGLLGFVQEWRAENALEALKSMLATTATVVRDGREQVIDTRDIVPNDLVIVEGGDRIPADLNILIAVQLQVDESVLTGESQPVFKSTGGDDAQLFMGTSVAAGRGEGRVIATGATTKFGQIADLTGSVGEKKTQLQIKLSGLARQLGAAALAVSALVVVLGLWNGRPLMETLMTGLSLAVALVPEGLPAVVTITLALGAASMARHKALARRLQAVETLGAASVICTDKTGTLTENKMTAARIWAADKYYDVTGTGYDPTGHIEHGGVPVLADDDPDLADLLRAAVTCNHARIDHQGDGWVMVGEPTEGALITLAYKGWVAVPDPNNRIAEIPFNSERKRMSILARDGGTCHLFAKGAPEQMIAVSTLIRSADGTVNLTDEKRATVQAAYDAMTADGLRVIAIADRIVTDGHTPDTEAEMEFLGLVGLIDPPRPEVRAAIGGARAAGIRVIMVTGDAPGTAQAIATQLGIPVDVVLTGVDVEEMTDGALAKAVMQDVLFARTSPHHKMRIVEALQAQDQIVAMTGDGVNDAPALKRADIGIAMGIRGTDVSKDAADLVLLDDNFATIVRAIGEGRRQFDNVRKFVRYLLSSNAGEVVAIVVNILIGGPLIFLATQILWMNLVTDGVTAVALGLEKATPGQMQRPPRAKQTAIIGPAGLIMILCFGAYTGAASLYMFYHFLEAGPVLARTAAFSAMIFFEKFSVFAFRSAHLPCSRIGWLSNRILILALAATLAAQMAAVYWPPLQTLLHTQALGWEHWGLIAALTLPLLIVPEAIKWWRQKKAP